jgi:hypothetical protein
VTPPPPRGFAALLARMPRRFRAQAQAVEERACQRREAQAKRFEKDCRKVTSAKDTSLSEWPDTVAEFIAR